MFGKFHYIISGFLFKKKVLHFVYELRVQIFIEQKIVELQKTKKCILYRHSITKKKYIMNEMYYTYHILV